MNNKNKICRCIINNCNAIGCYHYKPHKKRIDCRTRCTLDERVESACKEIITIEDWLEI